MSSWMMCGTHWGGCLGARHGWNFASQCGSNLGGSTGSTSGVVYGVCTLGGGVTYGGDALLNVSTSFRSAAVCLSPNDVSGLVGVGLRRGWVRSAAACVDASLEDSIGKVSVSGGNPWCLRLFLLTSWGCRTLSRSNVSPLT